MFVLSTIPFHVEATKLIGLTQEGDELLAPGFDPQVMLEPTEPIPAGWYRFELEAEGRFHQPRIYFDFGDGFAEPASLRLDSFEEGESPHAAIFLPAPVRRLRLDPSDQPGRFRLTSLRVEPLPAPAIPSSDGRERSFLVIFAERSHLSGVSVRLDLAGQKEGVIELELFASDNADGRPLRRVAIALALVAEGEPEHLYWEPLAESKRRFFFLRIRSAAATLLEAKPIYSPPHPYAALPPAVLFSPVSQCNLNCSDCISRPTRDRLRFASEVIWDAVTEVTRGPRFEHLGMDYSGDILFDERRYPGTLARIIALDAAFRIDTNANCLDDDITELLLSSRLKEINFSLDSMDAEVYRRIRRGSIPLSEVLAKIARFMARKRTAGRKFRTILSFVLMRSNAATIKPALAFAQAHGIDYVNVFPLLAFTEEMVEEIFVWDEVAFARLHQDLVSEAARLGVSLVLQAPVKSWREDDLHAPCEVPFGSCVFTANGEVMACCVPGTVIGNLNRQSLAEIWNGPEFAAFRSRVNSPDPPASCRHCGFARVRNNRKAYAPVRDPAPEPVRSAFFPTVPAESAAISPHDATTPDSGVSPSRYRDQTHELGGWRPARDDNGARLARRG